MKDFNKEIARIDEKLAELDSTEESKKEIIKKEDNRETAYESISEIVAKLNSTQDLESYREQNKEEYEQLIFQLVADFNYLKRESRRYLDAKRLIMTLGANHSKLNEWCKEIVNDETIKETNSIMGSYELNLNQDNELRINDNLKLVVNSEQAKDLIDNKTSFDTRTLEFKVVENEQEYLCSFKVENLVPTHNVPEDCPINVVLTEWKKNSQDEYILVFNLIEKA